MTAAIVSGVISRPVGSNILVPVPTNPLVIPNFTPAALNTVKWTLTYNPAFASPNGGYQALLLSNDTDGGAGMWMHDNGIGLYTIGGGAFESPTLTWGASTTPITLTLDPGISLEIAGALSGNGIYDISSSPGPYWAPGTDMYVGCYGDIGSYTFLGTLSNVVKV